MAYLNFKQWYTLTFVVEFQEQLKTLVPLLLEYVFLSSEEFRGTHEREAREVWQQDKKELLEELKKSHIERVRERGGGGISTLYNIHSLQENISLNQARVHLQKILIPPPLMRAGIFLGTQTGVWYIEIVPVALDSSLYLHATCLLSETTRKSLAAHSWTSWEGGGVCRAVFPGREEARGCLQAHCRTHTELQGEGKEEHAQLPAGVRKDGEVTVACNGRFHLPL